MKLNSDSFETFQTIKVNIFFNQYQVLFQIIRPTFFTYYSELWGIRKTWLLFSYAMSIKIMESCWRQMGCEIHMLPCLNLIVNS